MEINIAKIIPLPISKSSFVPYNSANNFLAFSTSFAHGIQIHKIEADDQNENDETISKV